MIRLEIRLIPATSTTEYIIVTSTEPTYGLVSPDATVETISFGTPTGSRPHRVRGERRAARAAERADRVEPALGVEPAHTTSAAPRPIASIAAARSRASASACTSAPAAAATSWRVTSGSVSGSPRMPASTSSTSTPRSRMRSRR